MRNASPADSPRFRAGEDGSPGGVSARLYEHGRRQQEKLASRRSEEEAKVQGPFSPEITRLGKVRGRLGVMSGWRVARARARWEPKSTSEWKGGGRGACPGSLSARNQHLNGRGAGVARALPAIFTQPVLLPMPSSLFLTTT